MTTSDKIVRAALLYFIPLLCLTSTLRATLLTVNMATAVCILEGSADVKGNLTFKENVSARYKLTLHVKYFHSLF